MAGDEMLKKFECMRSHSGLYIPEDLIIKIISRLPAKSLARFRCVSTAWVSISTDPSFILAQIHRTPKALVFHFIPGGLRKTMETFPPLQNDMFTVCIGKRIFRHIADVPLSSCDGLVCFSNFRSRVHCANYVLNPLTGLRIDLPSHPVDNAACSGSVFQLYYHRWTEQYRLFSAHDRRYGYPLYADILSIGGAMNSWRRINSVVSRVCVRWRTCIMVNDCFYWICVKVPQDNAILVFDILKETFHCMELPPTVVRCNANFGLLDIEGKLCCWMGSNGENLLDINLITIWVAMEGEQWRATYSLYVADEWRRPIYPDLFYVSIEFVFFSRGDILFVIDASRMRYLLCWDLKSGNHYTIQLSSQRDMKFSRTLVYGETLIDMATIRQDA